MYLKFFNKYQVTAVVKKFLNVKDSSVFLIIFIICFIYSLWALSIGWNNTILDQHGFRQTQTAISTYYIIQGSPWLRYETPVLGYPWSIPFEFPLYQWLVAILVKFFHTPLEETGRFVSVFFFYLSLIPSYIILDYLNVSKSYRWVFLSLFLTSPLYLFWSRTFMIESTALFFSLAYLAAVGSYFQRKIFISLVLAILFGMLGALVKITTFVGFVLAAGFFTLSNWLKNSKNPVDIFYNIILPAVSFVLLPYITASTWIHFTDSQKLLNPLAVGLTSKALTKWNFGTLQQRFSIELLRTLKRILEDLFGNWKLAVIILVIFLLFSLRQHQFKHLYLSAISIFFAIILTFTNLHIVHNYYQYANGIFLIAAIGFGLLDLLERRGLWKILGCGILALLLIFSIKAYRTLWTGITKMTNNPLLEISVTIQKYTNPNDVLLIYGLDWSSELPYYSQRRALMGRDEALDNPEMRASVTQLSGYKLGAMVFCTQTKSDSDGIFRLTTAYNFQRDAIYSNSLCQVHLPLHNQINWRSHLVD